MEAVFFELNNWFEGRYYPEEEPFVTWMGNDFNIYFCDENWVKENKLCVVQSIVDMSVNFCVTATKEWVEKNCPMLLKEYRSFLRHRDEDGFVYGQFGDKFLEYSKENVGIKIE